MSFLETVAAPIRPASVVLRPAAAVLRPVLLPRLLVEAAADVRSIAVSTRELTVAVNQLADIDRRVSVLEERGHANAPGRRGDGRRGRRRSASRPSRWDASPAASPGAAASAAETL